MLNRKGCTILGVKLKMHLEKIGSILLCPKMLEQKEKDMGFGLPICKRIVEAHGGKINVRSTFRKGTQFTINIPINPKPTSTHG